MNMLVWKRILNAALFLAAVYGLSQVVHPTIFHKIISPIASAVWGS